MFKHCPLCTLRISHQWIPERGRNTVKVGLFLMPYHSFGSRQSWLPGEIQPIILGSICVLTLGFDIFQMGHRRWCGDDIQM